ncbi:MAG: DUF2232 domain-containing protein [Gemmatimonadetes bacterium]|nr:DUF2232 domain-containing protein [Gemmatimonadota bacterium]
MEVVGGEVRGRWSTALALGGAVLLLYVLDAFPLIALPLAVLLIALPPWRPATLLFAAVVLLWALVVVPGVSAYGLITRGWALLVAGLFVGALLLWPRWSFLHRALAAVAGAMALAGAGLAISGSWSVVDGLIADFFRSALLVMAERLNSPAPDSRVLGWLQASAASPAGLERVLALRSWVFPALLALQSLAALGVGWWAFVRMGGVREGEGEGEGQTLRPLRDFRFHDQLIWLVIGGLVLLLLPLGPAANRVAANLLVFMGALYALRGVAIFVFLAGRAPSRLSVFFGALAALFLSHLVLTAAVLVGLGDTWLDVRRRVALASAAES